MKVNKTSKYTVIFSHEEVKEALVHWMSVGQKSQTQTINLAALINNSACKIETEPKNYDHEGALSVSFEWKEKEEDLT